MPDKHSRDVADGRAFWWTEGLWAAAEGLPVFRVPIAAIKEFDEDCWFNGTAPTCREVAEHALRITRADLRYPIIFASDGRLMDGRHRIAHAWMEGVREVDAVRFDVDPEPDWPEPASS
ncbi:chromosome partitioning protein ParB [Nocardioides panacisoli]|uniref:Chromosome partitioning protein ParB n=1 Tax=Nocardioides panacisoli TaxID=627624 RepID=A0ABP7J5T6_9ACTN